MKNMFKRITLTFMVTFMLFTAALTLAGPINTQVAVQREIAVQARVGGSNSGEDDASMARLKTAVDNAVSDKTYKTESGVTYRGNQLVKNGVTTDLFQELSKKEQDKLIKDMTVAVDGQVKKDQGTAGQLNPVVSGTKSNWMTEMLQQPGVAGSTFAFLEDGLSADFMSAQRILGPLYPLISIALGVAIVGALLVLFLNFGIDIFVLVTPAMQQKVLASGGGQGKGVASMGSGVKNKGNGAGIANFVSMEATSVIKEAMESGNANLGSMIASYAGKRFFGLLAFVAFAVIVASGNVMTFVGTLLDMVARMFGF